MGTYTGRYLTAEVAPILLEAIAEHEKDHPPYIPKAGDVARGNPAPLSGRGWLAFEAEMKPNTVDQIVTQRRKTCEGRIVDRLLTAVGRPDLMIELTEVDVYGRVRAT